MKRGRLENVRTSSTDIQRTEMRRRRTVAKGVGLGVREEGRREKGTIKISAIQSLAGNSRAWHLYY